MAYKLEWSSLGVIKKFTGVVSDEEFIDATEKVQGHVNFDKIQFVINDLSEVSSFAPSFHVVEYFFGTITGAHYTNPNIKIGFIIANVDAKRLIREYLRLNEIPYQLMFFDSLAEARQWCKG